MHKFQISGRNVTYRNKHLNRESEHLIQAENRYPGLQVWADPCGSLMGRAFSTLKQMGKCLTVASTLTTTALQTVYHVSAVLLVKAAAI